MIKPPPPLLEPPGGVHIRFNANYDSNGISYSPLWRHTFKIMEIIRSMFKFAMPLQEWLCSFGDVHNTNDTKGYNYCRYIKCMGPKSLITLGQSSACAFLLENTPNRKPLSNKDLD